VCLRVCACVCVRARVCMFAFVRVCVCVCLRVQSTGPSVSICAPWLPHLGLPSLADRSHAEDYLFIDCLFSCVLFHLLTIRLSHYKAPIAFSLCPHSFTRSLIPAAIAVPLCCGFCCS